MITTHRASLGHDICILHSIKPYLVATSSNTTRDCNQMKQVMWHDYFYYKKKDSEKLLVSLIILSTVSLVELLLQSLAHSIKLRYT